MTQAHSRPKTSWIAFALHALSEPMFHTTKVFKLFWQPFHISNDFHDDYLYLKFIITTSEMHMHIFNNSRLHSRLWIKAYAVKFLHDNITMRW